MISAMDAAVLAIGSELLGTDKLDTNSLAITACLESLGVEVMEKRVVADDETRIAAALRQLAEDYRLVIATGGLGPTQDDCTRAAAAEAFDRDLTIDEAVVEAIRARFAAFGRSMPEVNRRQAAVISGATVIENPRGTAPGQRLDVGDGALFLLPGVPRELAVMLDSAVRPWLEARSDRGHRPVMRHTLRIAGLPESAIEQRLAAFYERFGRESLSVLARPGDVRLVLKAQEPADAKSAQTVEKLRLLRELMGDAVYSDDADTSLAAAVVSALRERGLKLAVAESCTGGLVAERITRVPGASAVFLGGGVTYADALKIQLAGVTEQTIAEHGAVSEPVARAMAEGAAVRFGADCGIGITGIAGPGGGSALKPVGTVHVAVAAPAQQTPDRAAAGPGLCIFHRHCRFPGERAMVRSLSAQTALDMLRRWLLGLRLGDAAGGHEGQGREIGAAAT